MAVKRLTIELDDDPETDRSTAAPSMLFAQEKFLPVPQGKTDIPARQAEYQEAKVGGPPETDIKKETIGRTPSDLVFAFVNRAEFITTGLVFLSFLVSVGKLGAVRDFWIPLAIAVVLNLVWFGTQGVRKLIRPSTKVGKE